MRRSAVCQMAGRPCQYEVLHITYSEIVLKMPSARMLMLMKVSINLRRKRKSVGIYVLIQ